MCVYRKLDVAIKRFRPQVVYLALSLRCRTSKFMTVNGIWANKQKKNVTDSATKRFNNIKKAKGLLISGILKTKKKEKLNQKNKSTICNATTSQTDEFALHWWRTLFRIQNSRKWPYLEHYSEHTTIGTKKRSFHMTTKTKRIKRRLPWHTDCQQQKKTWMDAHHHDLSTNLTTYNNDCSFSILDSKMQWQRGSSSL